MTYTIIATDKMAVRKQLEACMAATVKKQMGWQNAEFTVQTKAKPVQVKAFWADELLQFVTPIAKENR